MKRLIISFSFITALFLPVVTTASVFAQDPLDPVCQGAQAGSAACRSRTVQNPVLGSNGALTRIIQILIMITGVASVIMIMVGGFKYVISAGDPANINSAKNTILYAIIGLVVAIFAQAIVSFVLRRL